MSKLKKFLILLVDVVILYLSLAVTLSVRYGPGELPMRWDSHFFPFSVIFIVWIATFYIFDLYNYKRGKEENLLRLVFWASLVSGVLSVAAFYFFPDFFGLTPKTNIVIFGAIALALKYSWHRLFLSNILEQGVENVILVGDSPLISKTYSYIKENPHIGYEVTRWIKDTEGVTFEELSRSIEEGEANIIVIKEHLRKDERISEVVYNLLAHEVNVVSFWNFYETVFEKVPLEELEEGWFVENVSAHKPIYDKVKRIIEVVFSILMLILFSPIIVLASIFIGLTSKGPVIFKQERVGKGGEKFTLYKFRTMYENSDGPLWTEEGDDRVTPIGKVLRYTHLDELPQLFNVLKGDISLIGPRPEREELAEKYSDIPYYEIRQTVKPGVTGWAQLNFPASASIEEAKEKLCFDVYYIKNRSIFLDLIIVFRTVRLFFTDNKS